jgi:hypothetical protein
MTDEEIAELKKLQSKTQKLEDEWDLAATAKAWMLGETCHTCTYLIGDLNACRHPGIIIRPKKYMEYCRPRILATYFEVK